MLFQVLLFYLLIRTTVTETATSKQNVQVCEEEQCAIAAEILKKSMNKSIDPCEDFYTYSCGGWASNFPLPINKEIWSLDGIVETNIILEIKKILEEEDTSDDSDSFARQKIWYKACLDTDKLEEMGLKPVEEILSSLGGWPMLMGDDWNSDDHDWQKIHEYYSSFYDWSSLFTIYASGDSRFSQNISLVLFKPYPSLYDRLLVNKKETNVDEKYRKFVKNVAQMFAKSANKIISDKETSKDIEELLKFESNLHLIKSTAKKAEDLELPLVYVTIKELQDFHSEDKQQSKTSRVNWLQVFKTLCKNACGIMVNESTVVGIEDGDYLRKLLNLLDATPNRVIVNYVHWKFIASSLKYLNKEARDLFGKLTSRPDESALERWEECFSDTKFSLGLLWAYMKRNITEDTKKMINDMTNELRSTMLDEIEHSDWVDEDTKEESMSKLHRLNWSVGVSSQGVRMFAIHFPQQVTVASNYFEILRIARQFWVKNNLKLVGRIRNIRQLVTIDQLKSVIYYDFPMNTLVLTMAQLRNPFLQSNIPLSMKYGYMAPMLARQMLLTMSKEVNMDKYTSPWSRYLGETYTSYGSKTACFERQYRKYFEVEPKDLDNIMYRAIGLKVAYEAFQANVEKQSSKKLPGFGELTNDQLFFVSYAQLFCQITTPKYEEERDPAFSMPNNYKVIGALSNFEYFAKAFNCPVDSVMNPQEKCVL